MIISLTELRRLPQQRLHLSFCEELDGLGAVKPVIGELTIALNSVGVRVKGTIETLLKLNCHRCLKPYFQNLQVLIDERFSELNEENVARDRELNKDDFVEPLPPNGKIDISDIVYQAVTLATPTYCRCGNSCPGPQIQGQRKVSATSQAEPDNSKIDPRWQNLKTLFSNDEINEN